jgi:hypothetical protein
LVHSDNPKRRFVEAMQQYLLMMVGETEDVTALAAV